MLLRSILGAAFLYVVYQNKILIGLPEVVELEIKKHTRKYGVKATEQIKDNYSIIEKLISTRDEYNLPSPNDFEQAVDDRLKELDSKIIRIPFKFSHAKNALTRVMEETAPNSYKNQQFKDSAIWEAVLEVSKSYNVFFITEDKAFFKDRNYKNGLASNLAEELKEFKNDVKIFYGMDNFLKEIKQDIPPLNNDKIVELIDKLIKDEIEKQIENSKVNEISNYTIKPYLTESPNEIVINFDINYKLILIDTSNENEWEGSLTIEGECLLDIENYVLFKLQLDSLIVNTPENCPIPNKKSAYIRVSTTYFGRRKVKYAFKEPLDL